MGSLEKPAPLALLDGETSRRRAGIVVPLFSLRSASSWVIGEIPDLVGLAAWAARMGQGVVQLLPINETGPEEASPYAALSAFALDPLYLGMRRVEDVGLESRSRPSGLTAPAPGGALPRAAVRTAKLAVLEKAWQNFRVRHLARDSDRGRHFAAFVERESAWLEDYALFRALKERQGWRCWEEWPQPLREREPRALRRAAADLVERVDFFRYVQWLTFEQWDGVRSEVNGMGVALTGDLPFVIGRDSADAWAHPELLTPGWDVGAPPDEFSAAGQNWELPLYDWRRAAASDFPWWRIRVRQAARLFDIFRIDHIVGVFRTYAIPRSPSLAPRFHPEDEAEQIAQGTAFLSMVLEEADGSVPIVEDLGTIPAFVRAALRDRGIRGYAVLRWEKREGAFIAPRDYPRLSVATTGTHDTSTLVEWWTDLTPAERRSLTASLGVQVPDPWLGATALREALRHAILEKMYEAGSDLVILPVQDLFGWPERINLPMTVSPRNWNYQLPFELGPKGQVPPAVGRETKVIRDLVLRAGRDAPARPA